MKGIQLFVRKWAEDNRDTQNFVFILLSEVLGI